nr:gustatory receptor 27 [Papilio machaon]
MNETRRSDSQLDKMLKHNMNLEEISKKIINCIKPSLVIEYCYGIFRYRLNGSILSPIDRRMKIFGIIITTVWITSVNLICIIPKLIVIFQNNIDVGELIRELPWLVCCVQYAVSNIILFFWQSENNLKILEKFAKFDIITHASMNRNFYQTSQNECRKLIFGFFLHCILMTSIFYVYEENFNYKMTYLFLLFERKLGIVVFCEFLHLLTCRMLLVKNYLQKFMTCQQQPQTCKSLRNDLEGNINFIGTASVKNNKISDLTYVYKDMGNTCNIINNIFNFFITTSIISTFLFIISFFWATMKFLKVTGVEKTTVTMIKIVVWSLIELFSIFIVSNYCEKIVEVKEDIISILNEIVNDEKLPNRMRDQAKVFVEITDIWPMSIQAYDMFQIDKNLILKFIGICTSYLIVVIQIDDLIQEE